MGKMPVPHDVLSSEVLAAFSAKKLDEGTNSILARFIAIPFLNLVSSLST